MPQSELLEQQFLRKLERLAIATRRVFVGSMKGERPSPRHGTSIEFADFRPYVPGDDFRRIDWPLYGRLEKLFLKLFVEEEDLFVYIALDCSRSMAFGEGERKLTYAKKLAAALAYVALCNLDQVGLFAFSQGLGESFGPVRGRPSAPAALAWLGALEPQGETNVSHALRELAFAVKNPGVLFVLSDLLDPRGYEEGLRAVVGRGFDVAVVHVLNPEELEPRVRGDLKLVDAETGQAREITVTGRLLRRYRERARAFCEGVRRWCTRHNVGYVLARTDSSLEDILFSSLRRQGFVR